MGMGKEVDDGDAANGGGETRKSKSYSFQSCCCSFLKKKAEKPPPPPSVPFVKLFRYADGLDYVLMVVGSVAAIVHGAALPVFFLFFGGLVNALGSNQGTPGNAGKEVSKYASYLVYLGIASFVSSYFEVSCWMTAGERQAARIRSIYLRAVLRQEVGYFDTFTSTGEIVAHISSDMVLIQDAIGEKVGNWMHFISTFVTGFVIGFTRIWLLALVILGLVPFIAAAGALYAITLTGLTAKGQEAYAEAGSIAEQNITQVRTVYSFTGEEKAVESYSFSLEKTLRLGIKAGFAKGWGLGLTFGILFCTWALNLYMAAVFIGQGRGTGGEALTTLFAVIIGGMECAELMMKMTTTTPMMMMMMMMMMTTTPPMLLLMMMMTTIMMMMMRRRRRMMTTTKAIVDDDDDDDNDYDDNDDDDDDGDDDVMQGAWIVVSNAASVCTGAEGEG